MKLFSFTQVREGEAKTSICTDLAETDSILEECLSLFWDDYCFRNGSQDMPSDLNQAREIMECSGMSISDFNIEMHTITTAAEAAQQEFGPEALPRFPMEMWRAQVSSTETILGYWEWVAQCLNKANTKDKGEAA